MFRSLCVTMVAFMLVSIFMDSLRYKKAGKIGDIEMRNFWCDNIVYDSIGFVVFFILGMIF